MSPPNHLPESTAAATPDFRHLNDGQHQLTSHLRDPNRQSAPAGVSGGERGLGVYRELIYNNVESLLAAGFPVINELLSDTLWQQLVREFLREHHSQTPYFTELGSEFVQFLSQRQAQPQDPVFLLELAHYERIEFDLYLADDSHPANAVPAIDSVAELAEIPLTLSTVAQPLAYQFPVHQICADFQPQEAPAQATFLLVFQDQEQDVRFFELTALACQLLQMIQQNNDGLNAQQLLQPLAEHFAPQNSQTFIEQGLALLLQFIPLGVLHDQRLIQAD